MARISTYTLDAVISGDDLLIGTDADDSNVSKNYKVSDIAAYVEASTGYITKKVTVSTAQLRTLGTTAIELIPADTESPYSKLVDVVSVTAKVNNQTLDDNLRFNQNLSVRDNISGTGGWSFDIEGATVDRTDGINTLYRPNLTGGSLGSLSKPVVLAVADLLTNPSETGAATTTIDVWLTYRIIDIAV
jgi:hypothetical protein